MLEALYMNKHFKKKERMNIVHVANLEHRFKLLKIHFFKYYSYKYDPSI